MNPRRRVRNQDGTYSYIDENSPIPANVKVIAPTINAQQVPAFQTYKQPQHNSPFLQKDHFAHRNQATFTPQILKSKNQEYKIHSNPSNKTNSQSPNIQHTKTNSHNGLNQLGQGQIRPTYYYATQHQTPKYTSYDNSYPKTYNDYDKRVQNNQLSPSGPKLQSKEQLNLQFATSIPSGQSLQFRTQTKFVPKNHAAYFQQSNTLSSNASNKQIIQEQTSPLQLGTNNKITSWNNYSGNTTAMYSQSRPLDNNHFSSQNNLPIRTQSTTSTQQTINTALPISNQLPFSTPIAASNNQYLAQSPNRKLVEQDNKYQLQTFTKYASPKDKKVSEYQLQEESRDWKKKYLQLKQNSTQLSAKISDLQFKAKDQQLKSKLLKQQNGKLQRKLNQPNEWINKYDQVTKQLQQVKKQNNDLKFNNRTSYSFDTHLTRINLLENENRSLKEQLVKLQKQSQKQSQGQIEQLNAKINDLTQSIQQLSYQNSNLKQVEKIYNQTKQHISNYMEKNKNLQAQLNSEIIKNKNMSSENLRLKNQLQRERQAPKNDTKVNTLQQQVSNLEVKLSVSQQNYNKLLAERNPNNQTLLQNKQLQQENQSLNKRILQEISKQSTAAAQINNLKRQIRTLQDDKNRLLTQKQSDNQLVQENQQLKNHIQAQQNTYLQNEQHFKRIIWQLEQITKGQTNENQHLKQQLLSKDQNMKRAQSDTLGLRKLLQQQEKRYLSQIQKLHTEVAIQRSQRQRQTAIMSEQFQRKQQHSKSQKDNLQQQANNQLQLKQLEIRKLVQELDRVKDQKFSQVGQLTVELINKQKIIKGLQTNNKTISSNFERSKAQYQTTAKILEQKFNDQFNNYRRAAQELQFLKNQRTNDLNSLQSQIRNRDSIIENLKKANLGAANDRYNLLLQEKAQLQKRLEQKEQQYTQIQYTSNDVTTKYNNLKREYDDLQQTKGSLERQNAELKQKYSQLVNESKQASISKNIRDNQENTKLKLENTKLQQKQKQLGQALAAQKQQLKNQSKKALSLSTELNQLKQQFSQYERKYRQISNELGYTEQKKVKAQQDLSELNAKYKALGNQLKVQTSITDSQINRLNATIRKLQQQLQTSSQAKNQLQKQYNSLQDKCKALYNEHNHYVNKTNSKESQDIIRLTMENSSLKSKVDQLQGELNFQTERFQEQKVKNQNISLELASLRSKSSEQEVRLKEMSAASENNQKLNIQIAQLKSKCQEIQKAYPQLQNNLQEKSRQLTNSRREKQSVEAELYQLKAAHTRLLQQHNELSNQLQSRQNKLLANTGLDVSHLFHGDVLRDEEEHKLFLKQCIESHQKIKILDTRLIYRYDPLNKQNIHKYIDEKPQLVVVVKLVNGYFVAGYAEGYFKPRTPSEKEGLIMSLTNKKCYYLVERNKRSISYDDFFVIFGNSEIRIKSQEKKMFSNFGVSNSYYRHNGDGVNLFLGGTKSDREMEVVGYQFFQLILKQ